MHNVELPTIEQIERDVLEATTTTEIDKSKLFIQQLITSYMRDLDNGRGLVSEIEINGSIARLRTLNDICSDRRREISNSLYERLGYLTRLNTAFKKNVSKEVYSKCSKEANDKN